MASAPYSGLKLLIVDDEPNIRMLASHLAESWGYLTRDCSSAEIALHYLNQEVFNIVLTDIKMAKMDGLTFAEEIRKKTPSVAVVIMTGYASPQTAKKSQDIGAVYYLKKPINNDELADTLRIAAGWNISMLVDRGARRYLTLRKGHERDHDSRLTSIKTEIKRLLRSPGKATALRELVYDANVEKNLLLAELNAKFSTNAVKPF